MSRKARGIAVALFCLVLAVVSLVDYAQWSTTRRFLETVLHDSGVARREGGVLRDTLREEDSLRARLTVARALLAQEADPALVSELAPAARRQRALAGVANLQRSRSLAQQVLKYRPASWEANLVLGASSFLESVRTGAPAGDRDWEQALLRSHEQAPGQSEPLRFLAAAYLTEWSRLSETDREKAKVHLAEALKDAATLELLLPRWLLVAPSLEAAYSILPPTSAAWKAVMTHNVIRKDWERYCEARARYEQYLLAELLLVENKAARQLRAGDVNGARQSLLAALDRAPVHGPFNDFLESFLYNLPPGPVSSRSARQLNRWFEWARDRCLEGNCSVSTERMLRLAGLAELKGSERIAEAAIMSGDLVRAESYERRGFHRYSDDWAPYLLLKAQLFISRGSHNEARAALDNLSIDWKRSREYEVLAHQLDAAGAFTYRSTAEPQPHEWRSSSWTATGAERRISVPNAHADVNVEIDLHSTSSDGAAVKVLWNGDIVSLAPVLGSVTLRLRPPSRLETNTLSVVPLESGRIRLGEARFSYPG